MTQFTPITAAIGGALIGLSAVLMYRLIGRIAGVSGIAHNFLRQKSSGKLWRALFILGLVGGGGLYALVSQRPITSKADISFLLILLAGLLVGAGTRIGSGCTSGHGVCGMARFSFRSLVATSVFLVFGLLTASIVHGLWLT